MTRENEWYHFTLLQESQHTCAAGYLGESARSQSCAYLGSADNGAPKISLTREELVELLSQAVNGSELRREELEVRVSPIHK